MNLLEVENLRKTYPVRGGVGLGRVRRRSALEGVSFALAAGEALGLVGESGCGKSTLSRLVARLDEPDSGAIRYAGADIGATSARRAATAPWRADLQLVFQDPYDSLDPRRRVADAVAVPLRRLRGLDGDPLAKRVAWAFERVHLTTALMQRWPHQLSGGQLQRVAIARAIALAPRLLILDEPTSALDVSVQAAILILLEELRRELGLALLFVSHDLNVVRMVCRRALILHLGRIVEEGPTDTLFDQPSHAVTARMASSIPHLGRRLPESG